jgi:hypothetical protein
MLWENNSTIVVMLTKLREIGRVSAQERGARPGWGQLGADGGRPPTGEVSPVLAS